MQSRRGAALLSSYTRGAAGPSPPEDGVESMRAAAFLVGISGIGAFLAPTSWTRAQASPARGKEPRWRVSGRVVEAGTGRPVAGAHARVLLRRVPYSGMIPAGESLTADGEGRFRDTLLFTETYVLYAAEGEMPNYLLEEGKGTRPRYGQVFRPLVVGGAAGDTTECAVVLGPAATVRVTATDEKGIAVPGASVVAVSDDAPHPIQLMDCAKTDEKGSAEYLGLGEGSWRLLLCKRGVGVASADLANLKWGEERDVAVRLGPSGDLYVACHVRGTEGEGDLDNLFAVMCEVYDAEGRLVSAGPLIPPQWGCKNAGEMPTAKEDRTLLYAGSYAPGRYRVVVRSPRIGTHTDAEFARDCVEVAEGFVIEAGKDARVRLTLDLQPPAPR